MIVASDETNDNTLHFQLTTVYENKLANRTSTLNSGS